MENKMKNTMKYKTIENGEMKIENDNNSQLKKDSQFSILNYND